MNSQQGEPGSGLGSTQQPEHPHGETVTVLKQKLDEAEEAASLWRTQAEETRSQYIQSLSKARILEKELRRLQDSPSQPSPAAPDGDDTTELRRQLREERAVFSKMEGEFAAARSRVVTLEGELTTVKFALDQAKVQVESVKRVEGELDIVKGDFLVAQERLKAAVRLLERLGGHEEEIEDIISGDKDTLASLAIRITYPTLQTRTNESIAPALPSKSQRHSSTQELDANGNLSPTMVDHRDLGDSSGLTKPQLLPSPTRRLTATLGAGPPERQLEKGGEDSIMTLTEKCAEMTTLAAHWERQAYVENRRSRELYEQARHLGLECAAAVKRVNLLEAQCRQKEVDSTTAKKKLNDAMEVLERRTKEVASLRPFSPRDSTLTLSDVVRGLLSVNEEIFQAAAYLSEVFVYNLAPGGKTVQRNNSTAYYNRTVGVLGDKLAGMLASEGPLPSSTANPFLVQLVMQTALTTRCASWGSKWTTYAEAVRRPWVLKWATYGEPRSVEGNAIEEKYNKLFVDLYDNIQFHEDQAVARRWRSIAKTHLPFSSNGWKDVLMFDIQSILNVAGWKADRPDGMAPVRKRIDAIFRPLLHLRKMIGEDVTSLDLELVTTPPNTPFDPTMMEEVYHDEGKNKGPTDQDNGLLSHNHIVVCTTGMGLRRLEKEGPEMKAEMIAMPNVVTEKTIKEALEPLAPSPRKRKVGRGI